MSVQIMPIVQSEVANLYSNATISHSAIIRRLQLFFAQYDSSVSPFGYKCTYIHAISDCLESRYSITLLRVRSLVLQIHQGLSQLDKQVSWQWLGK
jgi:hypothetical protein